MEDFIDATVIVPTLGRTSTALNLSRQLELLNPLSRSFLFVFQDGQELSSWVNGNRNPHAMGVLCSKKGAASARNFGAQRADSRFLVFLDDDCIPVNPSWLVDLLDPLETRGAVMSTGAVLGWDAVSGSKSWMKHTFRLAPPFLTPWGNPASEKSSWCDTVAGGNFSIEKSVFWKKGGFSEEFGSPSLYEETELSLRVTSGRPRRVWFSHEAAVRHRQESSGGMRNEVSSFSEGFILEQKELLLRLTFGSGVSSKIRFQIYRLFRFFRRLLRASSPRFARKNLTDG